MNNPFLHHAYPTETLYEAVKHLLEFIDDIDTGPPTVQFGIHPHGAFIRAVREAFERQQYLETLRDEALKARSLGTTEAK